MRLRRFRVDVLFFIVFFVIIKRFGRSGRSCKFWIDVLLIIFIIFRWIRGTSAMSIFVAIVSLYFIRILVGAFGMKFMATLLDTVLDVGVLALIVIFQPEIRKFLIQIGNRYMANAKESDLINRLLGKEKKSTKDSESVNEIADACTRMAESKTGALIVITHTAPLEDIISTGDKVDATIHRRLIMSLFFKNSPLHDGAMIIGQRRITAAGCILPVSHDMNIPKSLGLRHRAALGMSQVTDAVCIIVSEETGNISVAKDGALSVKVSAIDLEKILSQALS